jgi:hypothetical protein
MWRRLLDFPMGVRDLRRWIYCWTGDINWSTSIRVVQSLYCYGKVSESRKVRFHFGSMCQRYYHHLRLPYDYTIVDPTTDYWKEIMEDKKGTQLTWMWRQYVFSTRYMSWTEIQHETPRALHDVKLCSGFTVQLHIQSGTKFSTNNSSRYYKGLHVHYTCSCSVNSLDNGTCSCLLWINKSRGKDKIYIWLSVWWKTTN